MTIWRAWLASCLALLALASCSNPGLHAAPSKPAHPAADGRELGPAADGRERDTISVVAAFYPLVYLAEQIGGDVVSVESLTQPGAEPHDVELSPRRIADLTHADLVLYQQHFQPAVDQAVVAAEPAHLVDVGQGIVFLTPDGAEPAADPAKTDPAKADPHIWLDPQRMAIMARAVAAGLIAAAPQHEAQFEANLVALIAELGRLDDSFHTKLATCQRREFVTSHAAFGYLAQRYNLVQIGVRGLDPDAEPSPARIAHVQQEVRRYGVTTIFYETLVSPQVATSIAADLGLQTAVLDPLEGLTDQSTGTDYQQVMRSNLAALIAGCT